MLSMWIWECSDNDDNAFAIIHVVHVYLSVLDNDDNAFAIKNIVHVYLSVLGQRW